MSTNETKNEMGRKIRATYKSPSVTPSSTIVIDIPQSYPTVKLNFLLDHFKEENGNPQMGNCSRGGSPEREDYMLEQRSTALFEEEDEGPDEQFILQLSDDDNLDLLESDEDEMSVEALKKGYSSDIEETDFATLCIREKTDADVTLMIDWDTRMYHSNNPPREQAKEPERMLSDNSLLSCSSPQKGILKTTNVFQGGASTRKRLSFAANLHIINSSGSESSEERICDFKSQQSRKGSNVGACKELRYPSPPATANFALNSRTPPIFVPIYLDTKSGQPLKNQDFEPFSFDCKGQKIKTELSLNDMLSNYGANNEKFGNPMLQLKKIILGGKVEALFRMEKVGVDMEGGACAGEGSEEEDFRIPEVVSAREAKSQDLGVAVDVNYQYTHVQPFNNEINHKMQHIYF